MLEAGPLLGVWAAGVLAGIASGLFGVGGGILMVPALLYLIPDTGFHDAKAASLVVIAASSLAGIWTHRRRGAVSFRDGLVLALGGVAGAALGALLAEQVAAAALAAGFGILLAATGARLTRGREPAPRDLAPTARRIVLTAIGAIAGLLAGLFGIGGGIVMVPGMLAAGITMHLAVGTSLVAVLGNALGGTITHLTLGYGAALATLGVPLALGAVPGAHLGAKLAHKLHAQRLQRAFGIFLMLIGAWLVADAVFV